ncbi:hypothetical protein Gpo141_00012174 [Globisporangium polare]
MQVATNGGGRDGGTGAVTPVRGMRIDSEIEDLVAAPTKQSTQPRDISGGGAFQPAAVTASPAAPKQQNVPAGSSSSSALRSLHTEHFEPPQPSLVQVLITLVAYFFLVTDIPRAGASVDELPYKQIEPNVFSMYGPTILPTVSLVRAYDVNDATKFTTSSPTDNAGIPVGSFKYATSSYGLRSILAERVDAMMWPTCMSEYDVSCPETLPLELVFEMLEDLVETITVNAVNTTSYKSMSDLTQSTLGAQFGSLNGSTVITREYLSTLPQRVRFAIRTKARWIDGASNFLSHYILDQKYWMSTWATVFDDFNASNPGMDICLDDLDRPLFCEKSWADFSRLAPDGSLGATIGKIWDDISDKAAALQKLHPGKTLDMTIVETETDPLTLLGGAVVLAHKLYNVVVVYRVRDCVQQTTTGATTIAVSSQCNTLELHDVRYEGGVLYTDAIEWRYITKTMRYFAQIYNIMRLLGLGVACYGAVRATKDAASLEFVERVKMALRILFAIPSQVVVYGSFIPVFVYAAAHVIDGVILYQINDDKMHSPSEFFSNHFGDMVELVAVRMRNVWVIAILARMLVFVQTSGGWTPAKGVSGIKGFLLPFISCIAIVFVLRASSLQDSRILETNEVEPAATFMYIRAETLDTWKMNAFGLYNDFLSLGLTAMAYVVVLVSLQLVRRCYYKRDTSKESLFFASSDVPYSAGFLWDPSCLVVCWGHEIYAPLLRLLGASGSLGPIPGTAANLNRTSSTGLARRGSNVVTKVMESRYVLMNVAFLSDPWNYLTMKFGHTRIHLFELLALERKLLHPYSKARFLREYEMKSDDLTLLGTFNVSELAWEQVITCR